MPNTHLPVLVGSSIPAGLPQLELHTTLKLGDVVLTSIPADKEEALAVAAYCRENGIFLCFSEFVFRGTQRVCKAFGREIPRTDFYSKADLDEIIAAAGEFYFGRYTIGEAGGILYWPKAYLMREGALCYQRLGPCETHAEAEAAYVALCREAIAFERREFSGGRLINVDSSLVFKQHCMAGIDVLCLEVLPGDPHLMHAAIRGAARAYAKPWGAHIAMGWYGGVDVDPLFLKRWKTSVYYSYIAGAEFIFPESGHYTYENDVRGDELDFHSPEMKRMRRILREAWQFSRIHTRPLSGPQTRIGVVHGRHDGTPGLWNRAAWGQCHDEKWLEGAPERGWRLVEQFHRKEDWNKATVRGTEDFSGNPPLGQFDVVPAEAPLDALRGYSCLVFVGWNTMDAELYEKLQAYVRAGGRLLMFLPQLSTRVDRGAALSLLNGGDFSDLFGVRVGGPLATDVQGVKWVRESSLPTYLFPFYRINEDPRFLGNVTPAQVEVDGARVLAGFAGLFASTPQELEQRPALVENRLGQGAAFLVTAWQYPGDDGLAPLAAELLRVALQAEQGPIRLLANDRVRYAVYAVGAADMPEGSCVVYLLNTDPDNAAQTRLWVHGRTTSAFTVAANDLRLAIAAGGLVVIPEDKRVDVASWDEGSGAVVVDLFCPAEQDVEVHNLLDRERTVTVNAMSCTVPARSSARVRIRQRIDPERAELFAADLLLEPSVDYTHAALPY